MQIGMTTGVAIYPGVDYEQAIDHMLWQARFADESGFQRLWIVEHHFTDFAMTGAPSVLLSQYAAITKNIRIGYAVAVLPLHHPIRLAEEISWLDNLSKGRVMVGIGPGFSPLEYGVYGVPVERKREYVDEGIRLIQTALSGESFHWNGEIWQIPEVKIQPPTYHHRTVPFYMATSSHESVARAARWDIFPLLGFRPNDVIADQIRQWRSVRAELGDDTETIDRKQREIGVLRRIVIGANEREAHELSEQGSLQFAEAIRTLNTASGEAAPTTVETLGADGNKHVMTLTAEDQRARSARNAELGTISGTLDQVMTKLEELEATGVGHVLAGFGGRGMPLDHAKHILGIVARDVLPRFND